MLDDENDDVFSESETAVEEVKEEKVETTAEAIAEPEAEVEESTSPEDKDAKIERLTKEVTGLHKARDAARHKKAASAKTVEPVKAPDPVTDPDGFETHLNTTQDNKAFEDRINLTTDLMQDIHGDFTEKWDSFMGLVSETDEDGSLVLTDKVLYDKLKAAPNPAKFAYNHVLERDDFLDKSSPDYEKNLRASIRAEMQAEMKGKGLSALDMPDLTNAQASDTNLEQLKDTNPEGGLWDD